MTAELQPQLPEIPAEQPATQLGRLATYGAEQSDIPTVPEPENSGLRADMIEKHYFAKPQKDPKPSEESGEQEQEQQQKPGSNPARNSQTYR